MTAAILVTAGEALDLLRTAPYATEPPPARGLVASRNRERQP